MSQADNWLPRHIGIIMDGNGRWAAQQGKPRSFGHRAGVNALREIIKHCGDLGIEYVTVYAFSTENFKRSSDEVGTLMSLLVEFLKNDLETIIKNGVRINVIGDIDAFPAAVAAQIRRAMQKSRDCGAMMLNIALAYGARAELVRAVKSIALDAAEGRLGQDDINEQLISQRLYTAGQPDPDLIIRTSGELRLSNFLLYQAAYAELYFTPVFWPDFTPAELDLALESYKKRSRRFGGV